MLPLATEPSVFAVRALQVATDLRRPIIGAVVLYSANVLCRTLDFLVTGASAIVVLVLFRLGARAEV